MKQRKGVLLLMLLLLIGGLLALGFAPVPTYSIRWWVMGGGGGTSDSIRYHLSGTAGQGVAGASHSVRYHVNSGFWAGMGIATPEPTPTRTPTPPPGLTPCLWLPVLMKNVWWP